MPNTNSSTIPDLDTPHDKGGVEMLSDPVVQEILMDITNDEKTLSIIECILNGKTREEEIAEELGIKLNLVRKVLYKLYDAGVATYRRSKDPETQWFTYSWKFDEEKVHQIITKKYEKFSREIEESLEYEEGNMFFLCRANGHRYNFEEASKNNFKCPKCGGTLEYQDNSTIILELKQMMEKNQVA
ncbi:transcription factor E [Methanobacterium paludis]|uniref:Transcription factor E n=1 Tax=Methanobacterium paludis (strain DSM 25820 / JCM 18151 / SWAN1) TaxID=868131 RepID=F6D5P2_METPW|nr:transcription factor E [Methanobacterium paludis]AEG18224.1 Transcription factor E [Methanobacterium paludis]